ncbi:MAG: rhamnulokinase [Sphaerochaetaceae bacterium]|nr:rhamnulokinase [Sphaerochaetaceae bacterium]
MRSLAIDIGASSGRHILGWMENGTIVTKEVYRFKNGVKEQDGHLVWDINSLVDEVKRGIDAALEESDIDTLSIDTWGVDYVLMRGTKEILPVYAYRDSRTLSIIDEVHSKVPFEELYSHTGCQFQSFNTIYQLYEDFKRGRLEGVTEFMMIPEYLMYRLTGNKLKEFTNATTTGLVNHESLEFDLDIIEKLGLPKNLFPNLKRPGEPVGFYKGIQVVLCATHDTASAVEGIPMDSDQLYLSSGTWSLLGVRTPSPLTDEKSRLANYSNEGGVGYNRYQKNIMGMWLVNELQREICPDQDIRDIVRKAEESDFDSVLDADDPSLLSPKSMKDAFDALLDLRPLDVYGYFRCAYRSLALSYARAVREIEINTGRSYSKLYIVGGGARNAFLNRLTEETSGKEVVALPIEATALGNLGIQVQSQK